MAKEKLSIVVSAYNEEANIAALYKELQKTIKKLPLKKVEIIFVNDGSSDKTYEECLKLQKKTLLIKWLTSNAISDMRLL